MATSSPTYIGLRTYRLNPVTTRRCVAAIGIGVPPALANWPNACTGGMRPTTISTTPSTIRQVGVEPAISQWVISHGKRPTTVPGATTKNAADAIAAVDLCMFIDLSVGVRTG